jgi:hypothetical protein
VDSSPPRTGVNGPPMDHFCPTGSPVRVIATTARAAANSSPKPYAAAKPLTAMHHQHYHFSYLSVPTLGDRSKTVARQEVMVRSCIQAWAWASFVVGARILISVPAPGLHVDILFRCTESCAVDWAGVSLVLAQRKVGYLAREISHVCHRACCCRYTGQCCNERE